MSKNISLSIIFNTFLSFIAVYFFCFALFIILNVNKSLAIILSLITGLLLSTCIFLKTRDAVRKSQNVLAFSKRKKQLIFHLATLKNSLLIDLFKGLLENKYNLTLTKQSNFLENDSFIFLPICYGESLTLWQASFIAKEIESDKKLIILSPLISPQVITYLNSIKAFAIFGDEFFNLFTDYELNIDSTTKGLFTKKFFSKKLANKFLVYGIFLQAFSLICFYPYYYIIIGSLFIIYGLLSMFFGETEKANSHTLEDILKE